MKGSEDKCRGRRGAGYRWGSPGNDNCRSRASTYPCVPPPLWFQAIRGRASDGVAVAFGLRASAPSLGSVSCVVHSPHHEAMGVSRLVSRTSGGPEDLSKAFTETPFYARPATTRRRLNLQSPASPDQAHVESSGNEGLEGSSDK